MIAAQHHRPSHNPRGRLNPLPAQAALCGLALILGLPATAGAAGIEILGGILAGPTNTGAIDYILIKDGAVVDGDVTNQSGGTVSGTNANAAVGVYESTVNGTIRNESGGTIGATDLDNYAIEVAEDAVVDAIGNSGALKGALSVAGTNLDGDGIDLTNSGSIDLTGPEGYSSLISGNYTQTGAGSSLAFTLFSFEDYAGLATLTVLGDVNIGGDLLLTFDASFSFVPGQRMTLIDVGGTRTGLFDNYADGALVKDFGVRQGLYIDYTDEGNIDLYTTPEPQTWLLIGLGLFGLLRFGRHDARPRRCERT